MSMMCCSERYNYNPTHPCKYARLPPNTVTDNKPFYCATPRVAPVVVAAKLKYDPTDPGLRYRAMTFEYKITNSNKWVWYHAILLNTRYGTPSKQTIAYGHKKHCAHRGKLEPHQNDALKILTVPKDDCTFVPGESYKLWIILTDLDDFSEIQTPHPVFTAPQLCQEQYTAPHPIWSDCAGRMSDTECQATSAPMKMHDCSDVCIPYIWLKRHGCGCNTNGGTDTGLNISTSIGVTSTTVSL
jgi:hypothetical protein